MKTEPTTEKYKTVNWVADYLQLHPETIRKMAREKKIPATRIGRVWRFKKSTIQEWLVHKTDQTR